MKQIGVAIIGTRGIGMRHARAVLAAGGARITACAARTRQSAERFASEFDVPFSTTRAADVARRSDVHAVVVADPNAFHAPHALAMLEAGKDVLVEKPMAMDAMQARKIEAAARRLKRVVLVGHMWRFDPEVEFTRKLVASGAIGRVVRTMSYGVHVNWGPSGWFTRRKLAGGGALADMGIHAIDTARYIIGMARPKKVYASVGTHYGDYDVDDTGTIMLTWPGGAVSVIECGWRQPHADRPYAGTQVYGTKGYAAVFPTEAKIEIKGSRGRFLPEVPPRSKHNVQAIYDRQMDHFLKCVRDRTRPSPGAEEGVINMEIVDAAYKSARTGRAVSL